MLFGATSMTLQVLGKQTSQKTALPGSQSASPQMAVPNNIASASLTARRRRSAHSAVPTSSGHCCPGRQSFSRGLACTDIAFDGDRELHRCAAIFLQCRTIGLHQRYHLAEPAGVDDEPCIANPRRPLRANAKEIAGIDPTPIVSLGGTDARLWRYKDIPAIV